MNPCIHNTIDDHKLSKYRVVWICDNPKQETQKRQAAKLRSPTVENGNNNNIDENCANHIIHNVKSRKTRKVGIHDLTRETFPSYLSFLINFIRGFFASFEVMLCSRLPRQRSILSSLRALSHHVRSHTQHT